MPYLGVFFSINQAPAVRWVISMPVFIYRAKQVDALLATIDRQYAHFSHSGALFLQVKYGPGQ